MKVAQIDVVYGQGSTGKIVREIHERLVKEGHQSKVYFGRGPEDSDIDVVKISGIFDVVFDAAASRLTGFTGVFSPRATSKLIEYLEDFKPDIVHLHEVLGYFVNYFELLSYLDSKKIPIVWTLHSEFVYTGRCGNSYECSQWMTACVKCPDVGTYPSSWFFDRSGVQFIRKKNLFSNLKNINFVPVSNWLGNRLKQSFLGLKNSKVIHNGIDVDDVFSPRVCSEIVDFYNLEGRFVVLSVSPDIMSTHKGGRWVLDIARQMINLPITFIMIGVKDPDKLDKVDNVIVLPPLVDQKKLADFFSISNIYLITSQSETFSLTTAESLACGTPVLGFDSGGPAEVAPVPYGKFVPYGNVAELKEMLFDFFSGRLHLASRSDCVQFARLNYSNERMFSNYVGVYNSLTAKGNDNEKV